MSLQLNAPTLAVFSHPNHEAVVFGMMQRIRPTLVFLTDGGGEERVAETLSALKSIDWKEKPIFLLRAEEDFYRALLEWDTKYFKDIAALLEEVLDKEKYAQILCDSVEFYNPVHDLTLPIVTRANRKRHAKVREVPLIYQKPSAQVISRARDVYVVNRAMPSEERRERCVTLTGSEHAKKCAAWDQTYKMLAAQMGPVLGGSIEIPSVEYFVESRNAWKTPGADVVVRYDRRGAVLEKAGKVERGILYKQHYAPLVWELLK